MFAKFRDSVKKEFHKLTGGSEEENVQLIELAEDCTSESILAVDEGRISQLTSLMTSGDVGCASGVRNVLAAALLSLVHAVFTCRADLSLGGSLQLCDFVSACPLVSAQAAALSPLHFHHTIRIQADSSH